MSRPCGQHAAARDFAREAAQLENGGGREAAAERLVEQQVEVVESVLTRRECAMKGRAMSESAAHGESTWTRKRTTAEGLMGRFWTFYSKVAQA